jgi:uncharacterized membrane protein YeaQ/YmgE (transglycosylase-associated protein family)
MVIRKGVAMNLVAWMAIGIAVGWLASLVGKTGPKNDAAVVWGIVAGTFGATVCAALFCAVRGSTDVGFGSDFSVVASFAALGGAALGVALLRWLLQDSRPDAGEAVIGQPAGAGGSWPDDPDWASGPLTEPGVFDSRGTPQMAEKVMH